VPTDDERYASWLEDFELIKQDVYRLHHHRFLFRETQEMIRAAELPESSFFRALAQWYAESFASGIRRLGDRRRGTISFVRLLDEIRRHPGVMSCERHVALWDRDGDRLFMAEGERSYDRFADATGNRVDAEAVSQDIAALNAAAARVETWVNENVAHRSALPRADLPTFAEVHAAVDAVGQILQKYASLLRAEGLVELVPVIQYDWKAPFRRTWLPEGN
jgi:hypothetical protein